MIYAALLLLKRKGRYIMIIDCILDRKFDDENGFSADYSPAKFYRDIIRYKWVHDPITAAMDYGEEDNVKRALCDYIDAQGYNPDIKEYIRSVLWL